MQAESEARNRPMFLDVNKAARKKSVSFDLEDRMSLASEEGTIVSEQVEGFSWRAGSPKPSPGRSPRSPMPPQSPILKRKVNRRVSISAHAPEEHTIENCLAPDADAESSVLGRRKIVSACKEEAPKRGCFGAGTTLMRQRRFSLPAEMIRGLFDDEENIGGQGGSPLGGGPVAGDIMRRPSFGGTVPPLPPLLSVMEDCTVPPAWWAQGIHNQVVQSEPPGHRTGSFDTEAAKIAKSRHALRSPLLRGHTVIGLRTSSKLTKTPQPTPATLHHDAHPPAVCAFEVPSTPPSRSTSGSDAGMEVAMSSLNFCEGVTVPSQDPFLETPPRADAGSPPVCPVEEG